MQNQPQTVILPPSINNMLETTLRSLLFKGTNFCVFCDLEKFAKFKDRKIYAACASGAALYSMRTLRAR